jgi:general transcriptional corepressor TUP1
MAVTELLAASNNLRVDLQDYGTAWSAIYSEQEDYSLTITLQQSLSHQSVVTCIRFSDDGQYLATGCKFSAHMFELPSGDLVRSIEDIPTSYQGDSYIWSICFTPDGKYLITDSEVKD